MVSFRTKSLCYLCYEFYEEYYAILSICMRLEMWNFEINVALSFMYEEIFIIIMIFIYNTISNLHNYIIRVQWTKFSVYRILCDLVINNFIVDLCFNNLKVCQCIVSCYLLLSMPLSV